MALAFFHLAAIQMAAADVQMRPGFLRYRRLWPIRAQHATQPVQSLSEIAAYHRGQAEVMRDQADVVLVIVFFRTLELGLAHPLAIGNLAGSVGANALLLQMIFMRRSLRT